MKKSQPKSLYTIFIGLFAFIMILMVSIQVFYIYTKAKSNLNNEISYNQELSLKQLHKSLLPFIKSYSINEYEEIIKTQLEYEDILAVIVEDFEAGKVMGEKSYLTGKIKNQNWEIVDYEQTKEIHNIILEKAFSKNYVEVRGEADNKIAKISIYTTDYFRVEKLNENIRQNVLASLVLFTILFLLLLMLVKNYMINPLLDIAKTLEHTDESGIPIKPLFHYGSLEFKSLSNSISKMVKTIESSNHQLKVQKDEFEAIFNNSNDGIAILDLNSNFLNFNDAYLQMTGYTREELLKKSCLELTLEEDKGKAIEAMAKVLTLGDINNLEKTCVVKDGKTISINMSIALMPDKQRLIITSRDVSKLKMMQSQAKLASMGQMLGNIAHQWRQPLSVISTNASGAKLQKELGILSDEQFYSEMDSIINQTKYLSETIDDFRSFIRTDQEKQTISLQKVLDKSLQLADATLKNNYIEVIKQIDQDIEIKGFENQLIQAFLNIFNNSKDAMKENLSNIDKRYILLETKTFDDNFYLIIKDNAGGIPSNVISRVLEPYFTTKHQSVGTGIGLSLVNEILTKNHDSTIEILNDEFIYKEESYKGACLKIKFCVEK